MHHSDDERQEYVDKISRDLGEHFDHVLVLVTIDDEEESCFYEAGAGNCFARRGMIEFYKQRERMADRRAAAEEADE